jgi:ribosomal protein L12E/L44/L45/RPP1/RPP2
MKTILAAVFAVLIGLAFSTTTFAQATPPTPAPPAGGEMKKEEGTKKDQGKKKEKKAKKSKKEKKENKK